MKWPLSILLLVAIACIAQIVRPFGKPKIVLTVDPNPSIAGTLDLNWPPNAQGAICIADKELISKTQDQSPKPTASVAKIMTAYLILTDHPLTALQDGPTLELTAEDEKIYAQDKSDGQSVAKVVAGEKLTERQMLEALLLPSANNIATALAKWNSGNVTAFVEKMNKTAKVLGMENTHYEDPAGINLSTRSTAYDQLLIAQQAMKIDTFREIVRMPQTKLPVAGTVYNVNYVLGKGGIVGIKTGSMPRVGGNFVFASYDDVGGGNILIIGALFGVGGRKPIMDALNGALDVLQKTKESLQLMHVVKKDEQIGTVTFRPGHVLSLQTTQPIDSIVWPQKELHLDVQLKQMTLPIRRGDILGTVTLAGRNPQKTTIVAAQSISKPTLFERLTRSSR
jgi:serine-type D-Ala-D-Ala carboxypeptidase (penicillin-binding protein 5/6)